jgi:hypothetical protein
MKRICSAGLLLSLTFLGALPCGAGAASRSQFSGAWKMDPARSESAHQAVPIGLSTVVIRVNGSKVTIETTRTATESSPEFHEILNFSLDGSPTVSTGNAGQSVTGKAHWDGAKLVTETVRSIQGSTVTTTYVHSLSADGRELTIDKTLTVQHGYQGGSATNMGRGRDVYIRSSR